MRIRKSDEAVVARVAAMMATAATESGYRRMWARVNRAAGMVTSHVAINEPDPTVAGQRGQLITNAATAETTATIATGLAKRVGLALYEWYTGACPAEEI